MKVNTCVAILVGCLGLAGLAWAQTAAPAAAAKGGATPEAAFAMLTQAAKAGDVDAAFGVLVPEQGKPLAAWFKTQDALARAVNAHVDALDAAFGKDDASPYKRVTFDMKADLARGFAQFAMVGKPKLVDDVTADIHVTISGRGGDGKPVSREETVKARKTDAGWKLLINELTGPDFAAAVTFMDGMKASLDRATKGVKDGSIKSRDDARKEIEKDRPASIPGNVPMPRFLTNPG